MVDRTIINPLEQMRSFDYTMFEHDVLVGLGSVAQDMLSGQPYTVIAGLTATQTATASLSVNIGPGRIYTIAPADTVAVGAIPQDLTTITQQGQNAGQTLTLIPPTAGQSQWNLIQCQFSQVDAVRANDPNNGVTPFYNSANPTIPIPTSINTVRQGQLVIQVITGSAATTGSEVPPQPSTNWTPMYLIDLAGGQTQITTAQCLVAGPSVGLNVPQNYPQAPFLAGFLKSHHHGILGQAPKIDLTSEVQGVLPYANMSPVRTLVAAPLTLYVNASTGSDANNGLAPGTAFKTIQAAVNAGSHNYDFNGNGLTISIANGTYTATGSASVSAVLAISQMPPSCSSLTITGNTGSPGSVTISGINCAGFSISQLGPVLLGGMTIIASGTTNLSSIAGVGISMSNCLIQAGTIVFGSCGSACLSAGTGATFTLLGPMTMTGTTNVALLAGTGSLIFLAGQTITVTGLVTQIFAQAFTCGTLWFSGPPNTVFIGTATGQKFLAQTNGTIITGGSGINYLPGSIAGTQLTGGQYT